MLLRPRKTHMVYTHLQVTLSHKVKDNNHSTIQRSREAKLTYGAQGETPKYHCEEEVE